jgi:2-keto-4-pentenoate hydratase/2-oxohepta-3-ene-1,7-dioic acid hydratase in catechol pathway
MRLATYDFGDGIGPGRVFGNEIADLRGVAPTMRALLAGLPSDPDGPRTALDPARLRAPVPDPQAFLGVGLNYRDHAAEVGRALPEVPPVFAKLAAAVAPPFGTVPCCETLDYETELGAVVGAGGRIAGYVVVGDFTRRALAKPDTLALAKGGAGHGPFGPWIVTVDELGDAPDLRVRTWVNGEPRQDSRTSQLHVGCAALVAWIGGIVPLAPGDIISTGSPGGSGAGFSPPRWLAPGDVVRGEIEGIGAIEHIIA